MKCDNSKKSKQNLAKRISVLQNAHKRGNHGAHGQEDPFIKAS